MFQYSMILSVSRIWTEKRFIPNFVWVSFDFEFRPMFHPSFHPSFRPSFHPSFRLRLSEFVWVFVQSFPQVFAQVFIRVSVRAFCSSFVWVLYPRVFCPEFFVRAPRLSSEFQWTRPIFSSQIYFTYKCRIVGNDEGLHYLL